MSKTRCTECLYKVSAEEWDDFLLKCDHSHHEQSSQYAVNRGNHGFDCDRIVIRADGHIIGGVQVLVDRSAFGKSALIWRGPIAVNDDPEVMHLVVRQLDHVAQCRCYNSVRVALFPNQVVAIQALKGAGFVPTTSWYREWNSVLVSLTLSDDELMEEMHKNVGRNVRRSLRKGVTIQTGDETTIGDFYDMHKATASFQAFPVFSRDYFSYVWDRFGRSGKAQHVGLRRPEGSIQSSVQEARSEGCVTLL